DLKPFPDMEDVQFIRESHIRICGAYSLKSAVEVALQQCARRSSYLPPRFFSTSGGRNFDLAGCLNLLKRHLRTEDFALKALGFTLIARFKYMLEEDIGKILEITLSDVANRSMKQGGHIVPVAAGVGDNNICGGIVHVYWNKTLGRCLDFDDLVRQSALK
ncbi:hypothetical protein AALP_AAs74821U000100, partial [Arabis alpina]